MPLDLAPEGLVAVSLGCYCGVKLSFRRLGLDSATLPLDWNRTRIEKVIEFLQTDFDEYLSDVDGPISIPNTKLSAFRGPGHSFWHDNIEDPDVQIKLERRIDRFLQLGASSRQIMFVRALATYDELAEADDLYAELLSKFGSDDTEVYLLVIVCMQDVNGPVKSDQSPGLFIFQLGKQAHGSAVDADGPAPFCEPIKWALKHIQGQGASEPRHVASALAMLESGVVTPKSVGLDGMEGIASFEASQADKEMFGVGARVEAWSQGTWYPGTVTKCPEEGCDWNVCCDDDAPGTSTITHRLRQIPVEKCACLDVQSLFSRFFPSF